MALKGSGAELGSKLTLLIFQGNLAKEFWDNALSISR